MRRQKEGEFKYAALHIIITMDKILRKFLDIRDCNSWHVYFVITIGNNLSLYT